MYLLSQMYHRWESTSPTFVVRTAERQLVDFVACGYDDERIMMMITLMLKGCISRINGPYQAHLLPQGKDSTTPTTVVASPSHSGAFWDGGLHCGLSPNNFHATMLPLHEPRHSVGGERGGGAGVKTPSFSLFPIRSTSV